MRREIEEAVARAAAQEPAVRVAYVFGSQRTGSARPDSDLDVAVAYAAEADDERRELGRRALVASLERSLGALGERSDIVDLDRANSAVAFRAIRDGLCAFSRTPRDRAEAEARVARRHDDDAPRRELFRRAARAAAARMGERRS
jgi:predicted nucleotidyltransferase